MVLLCFHRTCLLEDCLIFDFDIHISFSQTYILAAVVISYLQPAGELYNDLVTPPVIIFPGRYSLYASFQAS